MDRDQPIYACRESYIPELLALFRDNERAPWVRRTRRNWVALSGGVFQNAFLVERLIPTVEHCGFDVLTHRRIPPNDAGISLGQVAVAGARDRR